MEALSLNMPDNNDPIDVEQQHSFIENGSIIGNNNHHNNHHHQHQHNNIHQK